MAKVVGVGGVFFKAADPEKLRKWYEQHLGISASPNGMTFTDGGPVVFSIFPATTKYLGPSRAQFMINLRVDDMDALLEKLKSEGVEIDPKREDAPLRPFRLDYRSGRQSSRAVAASAEGVTSLPGRRTGSMPARLNRLNPLCAPTPRFS